MNCKWSSNTNRSNLQKDANHFYGKALKQRGPEEGIQRTVQKNPGRHLSAYQQMQLARQEGQLNQLCIRFMSK